jgi:simple sugar transport system permease protein
MREARIARAADAVVGPLIGLAAAVLVGNLLALAVGASPLRVWSLLFAGTWGSAYGVGQVLFKATPLALAGLSVSIGLRAGLFNVGAEGQLVAGALATTVAGIALPPSTPAPLAVLVAAAAGALAGGAVGAVPGALKARFGAHEVIGTIMLNFVVLGFVQWLVLPGRLGLPESQNTAAVIEAARIPRLSAWVPSLHGSSASFAVVAVLLVALAVHALFARTRIGWELRVLGIAPSAAEAGGVAPGRATVLAMALSGAVAGLAGLGTVLGFRGYFEVGFSSGVGFMGIAVAMLGRSHPAGVLLAAVLFGTLSQGALAIHDIVPKELVDVLQAVVVLAVVGASSDVVARRRA